MFCRLGIWGRLNWEVYFRLDGLNSSVGACDNDGMYYWNSHFSGNINVSNTSEILTGRALDTLCSQSWGSGNPQLVGLHLQRCLLLLLICHVPIAFIWGFSEKLLLALHQEPELSRLASKYLQILFFGMYSRI